MKKYLLSILCWLYVAHSQAQIQTITVQASGLTCSMCSKSIYKSLEALSFVQAVSSDIKNSSYTLHFKPQSTVQYDAIQKAIKDAGFSVAKMLVTLQVSNSSIEKDTHITLEGKTYHFMDVQPTTISGSITVQLIDKNFVTAKEYKKYSKLTTMPCYQTGYMQSCCKKNTTADNRIFHVVLSKA